MLVAENLNPHFCGHFDGLRESSLRFPFCEECHRFHWYPMSLCPHCHGPTWIWKSVGACAEIYSWTVIRRSFDPEFVHPLPYIVSLVTFTEAPEVRLVSNLVDITLEKIEIGMRLEPVFDPVLARVTFRPPYAFTFSNRSRWLR